MRFETKIAVVLRDDLAVWQKTNVTAFLVSGIAGTSPEVVGEPYLDASGLPAERLDLVGIALRADRRLVDKVLDKLRRHPCTPASARRGGAYVVSGPGTARYPRPRR